LGIIIISLLGIFLAVIALFALLVSVSEFFPNVKPKFKVPSKLKKGCDYIDNIFEDIA
jgi:hypothetical protein